MKLYIKKIKPMNLDTFEEITKYTNWYPEDYEEDILREIRADYGDLRVYFVYKDEEYISNNEWKNTDEILPELPLSYKPFGVLQCRDSEDVLICIQKEDGNIKITEGFLREFNNGIKRWQIPEPVFLPNRVTHWKKLPELPKEHQKTKFVKPFPYE